MLVLECLLRYNYYTPTGVQSLLFVTLEDFVLQQAFKDTLCKQKHGL